ncbi:UD11 glucuronosyltransferase, partial [Vidua chalybeata]|nr:UD11 glucuronosyltransferase [Vidua chalybeata]
VWVDGSPWFSMQEGLHKLQQKGHEVVVVAPEVTLHVKPSKNFVMKRYPVPFTQEEFDKGIKAFFDITFEEGSFLEKYFKVLEALKRFTDLAFSSCRHLLQNKELMSYLEESKF